MTAISRAANLKKHPNMKRLGWTIDEWCAGYKGSRSWYEAMRRRGKGPRELREGGVIRITPEADAEWRASRETKPAE
jgi:hypothetical protein